MAAELYLLQDGSEIAEWRREVIMRSIDRRRITAAVPLLGIALLSLSCLGPVVRERLELIFHPEGSVEIGVTRWITPSAWDSRSSSVQARLERTAEATLRDDDLWAKAFRRLEPVRERRLSEHREGHLVESFRLALIEDPERLPLLFDETPVGAFVIRDGSTLTLELVPSGASRATARQERRVREHMEPFTEAVAIHLRDVAGLYEYLEANPERVRPVVAELFGVEGEDREVTEEEEETLLRPMSESADALLQVLEFPGETQSYTLDELSQLVFDPFPAAVQIELAGCVEDAAGFLDTGDGRFLVPRIGLWSSLESLEEEWVSPLPVVDHVRALQWSEQTGEEIDEPAFLDSFLARPRRVRAVPSEREVGEALRDRLKPEEFYRLRWRLPPCDEEELAAAF